MDRVATMPRLPAGEQGRLILGAVFVAVLTLWMTYSVWREGRDMPSDLVGVGVGTGTEDFDLDLRYGPDYRDSDGDYRLDEGVTMKGSIAVVS